MIIPSPLAIVAVCSLFCVSLFNGSFAMAQDYLDSGRTRYEFDPDLIRNIVAPERTAGEKMLQYPFVPGKSIEVVMKSLDQRLSIATQMQMKYGLNSFNVSYYPDDVTTYAEVGDHRSGNTPNCFLCHSSYLENKLVVGLGNTRVDLRLFFDDLLHKNQHKQIHALPYFISELPDLYEDVAPVPSENFFARIIRGPLTFFGILNRTAMLFSVFDFVDSPALQSVSSGVTNPWSTAVYLFNWRDRDMNIINDSPRGRGLKPRPDVLDPMPWWVLKYKNYINWDGIIQKSPRVIIQAVLSPGMTGEDIKGLEPMFQRIYDEIHKMEPPKYPRLSELDPLVVSRGEVAFNKSCAKCHGIHSVNGDYTYRDPIKFKENYKNWITPLVDLGTDPQRAKNVNGKYLLQLRDSWLGYYNRDSRSVYRMNTIGLGPRGYQAPPLWGIWASAPYFHNGSIPNLRAVLFAEMRPTRWKHIQTADGSTPYDYVDLGLQVQIDVPPSKRDTKIYDTTLNDGRSNKGHDQKLYDGYDKDSLNAIFEYMKTL